MPLCSRKQQLFMTIHTTNIILKRVHNEMFSNSSIRKSSLSGDCIEMVSSSFDVPLVLAAIKKTSVLLLYHYKILSQIS